MNNFANQLTIVISLLKANAELAGYLVGSLWLIHFVNVSLGRRLCVLGIYPRHVFGIPGILLSPFLHFNFSHLFFNSIPLFVLTNILLLTGIPFFIKLSLFIIIVSGIGVWLFGRRAFHIGASALIMGYWSYLIINAFYQPAAIMIIVLIICIYYFGSLIFSLFPSAIRTSWEGHLFGFLAGVAAFYMYPMGSLLVY